VDALASAIRADPVLARSPMIDAIGISQGNLVIRGITKKILTNEEKTFLTPPTDRVTDKTDVRTHDTHTHTHTTHPPTPTTGYIQRYAGTTTTTTTTNTTATTTGQPPRVRRWISIHGPLLGVAGLPGCNRTRVALCNDLDSLVDVAAYSRIAQAHLAQVHNCRNEGGEGRKGEFGTISVSVFVASFYYASWIDVID
jgi:hypothetical protein